MRERLVCSGRRTSIAISIHCLTGFTRLKATLKLLSPALKVNSKGDICGFLLNTIFLVGDSYDTERVVGSVRFHLLLRRGGHFLGDGSLQFRTHSHGVWNF